MKVERKKILLAEDEENFGMVLKTYLELHQLDVDWCINGKLALSKALQYPYDLCIFDVMMPEMDGFELAREVRATDKAVPFIFLTARHLKEDMIKGFEIGADDYLTKPFDTEILLHKIKAILKRNTDSQESPSQFHFSGIEFDYKFRTLKIAGEEHKLSPKENALLKMLCEHMENYLPRRKALLEIWKDDSYFTTRSMDVYIAKLRKKFRKVEGVEIENIHGEGYRLLAELNA